MRFLIQRVKRAAVETEGKAIGKINQGLLVLVGISKSDTEETARRMVKKLTGLRIFEDENGKTNLDIETVRGELLVISQFTLYADCKKGNRPSFVYAGSPDMANSLYEYVLHECRKYISRVESGEFGADMKVSLVNDGPFTIILDSEEIFGTGGTVG